MPVDHINEIEGQEAWVRGRLRVAGQIESEAAQGTAPLLVASTTEVANLNAAMVGGRSAASLDDKLWVLSRGGNLISNSDGTAGDATNFSKWTSLSGGSYGSPFIDTVDKRFGRASYGITGASSSTRFSDEFIPVNTDNTYLFEIWMKCGNLDGTGYDTSLINGYQVAQIVGLASYDAAKVVIASQEWVKFGAAADTTLAQNLSPGDTQIVLTNATGWANGTESMLYKHMAWWSDTHAQLGWCYIDSSGNAHSPYSLTRYTSFVYYGNGSGTTGLWGQGGISGNTITLPSPWAGPALLAGTPVRNCVATWLHIYPAGGLLYPTQTWTRYAAHVTGVGGPAYTPNAFPPGTRYVRATFIPNYLAAGGATTNVVRYSGVSLRECRAEAPVDSDAAPGMAWANDPDTGFSRPAANTIHMVAGGSVVGRATSTGLRLGDTTNATERLDVVGSGKFTGNLLLGSGGSPGGTGVVLGRGAAAPDSGPAIRWSNGLFSGTSGLYAAAVGELDYQGESTSLFGIRQSTGLASLGTRRVQLKATDVGEVWLQSKASTPAISLQRGGEAYPRLLIRDDGVLFGSGASAATTAYLDTSATGQTKVGALTINGAVTSDYNFWVTGSNAAYWFRVRTDTTKAWAWYSQSGDALLYRMDGASGANVLAFSAAGDITKASGTKYWHGDNDGSASGLDADLLDGQHASAFSLTGHNHDGVYAPTSHSHDYLPLAGGTLSGALYGTEFFTSRNSSASFVAHHTLRRADGGVRLALGSVGAETGSGNGGFDFTLQRYADNGASLGSAIFVRRSDGFVGINTINPTERLHVGGNALVAGSLEAAATLIRSYTSEAAITNLVAGSTFGSIVEAQANGHLVVGLRSNDAGDSFSVITRESGNPAYSKLAFQVLANGNLTAAGALDLMAGDLGLKSGNNPTVRFYAGATPTGDAADFWYMKGMSTIQAFVLGLWDNSAGAHLASYEFKTDTVYVNGYKGWHAGNDGAGSSLDADTVDGNHAADFALAGHNHSGTYAPVSHTHDYLPLSGGTLTGLLTCSAGLNVAGGITATGNNAALWTQVRSDSNRKWGLYSQSGNASLYYHDGATGSDLFTFTTAGGLSSTAGTFWHSGNDGAGTGMDADLLDGADWGTVMSVSGAAAGLGGIYWDGAKWAHRKTAGYGWALRHGDANGVSAGEGGAAQILIGQSASTGAGSTAGAITYFLFDKGGEFAAQRLKSTVTTGTAPIAVSSTTAVTNLNADLLDGLHASDLTNAASHTLPTAFASDTLSINLARAHYLGWVGDALAFKTISSVEYYDFTDSTWKAWAGSTIQTLLAGRPGLARSVVAPANRKWRFVAPVSTYLGSVMAAVHQTWNQGAHQVAVTVEKAASASGPWTPLITETTSPAGESNYRFHVSAFHNTADTHVRFTVESKDEVNNTSYIGLQLLFSYTRTTMPPGPVTPFTWDWTQQVVFALAPKVGSDTVWHSGNDGSGSGLDADTVDGYHASSFADASSLSNHTASTTAHGISAWGSTLVAAASQSAARTVLGLGTAALKNAPASGNAGSAEVVLGNDSRLSDYRAPTAHSHAWADITSGKPTTLAGYGISDGITTATFNAHTGSTTAHGISSWGASFVASADASAARSALSLGTAATRNSPASGNAGVSEVVLGNDSRLGDSRAPTPHNHAWADITSGKPTSLAGYGISDGITTATFSAHTGSTTEHGITMWGGTLVAAADQAGGRSVLGLGSSAVKDVPSTGDASAGQVVLGSDSRLSDYRMPLSHTHWATDVTSGNFNSARLGTGSPNQSSFLRYSEPAAVWSSINAVDIAGLGSAAYLNVGTGATNVAAGDHTHSYLPLSGGTVTGSTTFQDALSWTSPGSDINSSGTYKFIMLDGSTLKVMPASYAKSYLDVPSLPSKPTQDGLYGLQISSGVASWVTIS